MIERKILFATDFSSTDREAFHQACLFARAWQAKLLIVHVNESNSSSRSQDVETMETKKGIDVLGMDLHNSHDRISHEHITRTGDPAEVILGIEQEQNVDLIVLGTHGRKGFQRVLHGSVAETVIRCSHCPVLTLRSAPDAKPPASQSGQKVLVPIDFSVHSLAALDLASTLAQAIQAEITILHVDDSNHTPIRVSADGAPLLDTERMNQWNQLKGFVPRSSGIRYEHKILPGPATKTIPQFANQSRYDYVVLGTHGRTGIGRALMGSVTEQVTRNSNCPVVAVKPNNKRSPVLPQPPLSIT